MFFKDNADYNYKDLGDIAKPVTVITLENSIILGACLFIILTFLFYPTFITEILTQCIESSLL